MCRFLVSVVSSLPHRIFTFASYAYAHTHLHMYVCQTGSGGVVAAPDHDTGPGGDYYFHWQRDGALSMQALLRTNLTSVNVTEKFDHYIDWVATVQAQTDPNGIDVRGEPKFTLPDGAVYTGGWCRPQDDGPALRAKTLMEYANLDDTPNSVVTDYLWTSSSKYNGGLVK